MLSREEIEHRLNHVYGGSFERQALNTAKQLYEQLDGSTTKADVKLGIKIAKSWVVKSDPTVQHINQDDSLTIVSSALVEVADLLSLVDEALGKYGQAVSSTGSPPMGDEWKLRAFEEARTSLRKVRETLA